MALIFINVKARRLICLIYRKLSFAQAKKLAIQSLLRKYCVHDTQIQNLHA